MSNDKLEPAWNKLPLLINDTTLTEQFWCYQPFHRDIEHYPLVPGYYAFDFLAELGRRQSPEDSPEYWDKTEKAWMAVPELEKFSDCADRLTLHEAATIALDLGMPDGSTPSMSNDGLDLILPGYYEWNGSLSRRLRLTPDAQYWTDNAWAVVPDPGKFDAEARRLAITEAQAIAQRLNLPDGVIQDDIEDGHRNHSKRPGYFDVDGCVMMRKVRQSDYPQRWDLKETGWTEGEYGSFLRYGIRISLEFAVEWARREGFPDGFIPSLSDDDFNPLRPGAYEWEGWACRRRFVFGRPELYNMVNWVFIDDVPRFEREARRISEAEDDEMSRKIEEYREEHPRTD